MLFEGRPSWLSSLTFFARWGLLALLPGIVASFLAGADVGTGLDLYQWWLISILLLCVVIIRDAVRRLGVRYTVTTERIHIRRGIVSRREQSTDIDRVQSVNMSQSLLERTLNIGKVDFDTAGTNVVESDFRFVGVSDPRGVVSRLQGYLIERERSRGDARF
jgi:putative membrane protein